MRYLRLIFKNVSRNLLRSILTALGTMVLVCVVTMVWSILTFFDSVTAEKSKDFKAIVSEKWSMPSHLPLSYADRLGEGAAEKPGDARPTDSMTWEFYLGSFDAVSPTRDSNIFVLAMDPAKILTMMEGMDEMTPGQYKELEESVKRLKENKQGIILGHNHVVRLQKLIGGSEKDLIGQRKKLIGQSQHKELDLEVDIVGVWPPGRYDNLAVCQRDYYNDLMDEYPSKHNGRAHPLSDRRLSILWLKVPNSDTYNRVAEQITKSPYFSSPAVKIETASSAFVAFLEPLRDLLWGVRFLLVPACIASLSLVIANAISISVRERRKELAVMKVLGFRPWQLMVLVLGEALMLGLFAGVLSAALTYTIVNWGFGGLRFPLGFFPCFLIPIHSLEWGALLGAGAAIAGSVVPAFSASRVAPAEVFSKVA